MRRLSVVVLMAIVLSGGPSGFAANSIAWGPTVNGLRLGAAFASDPSKPTLCVVFQNVGSAVHEFVVAHATGAGPIYGGVKFIAISSDGKQQEFVHRGLYIPIEGLVTPVSVRLNASETHELQLPLKDIIYASRTTVTLDALVKQGYSVRIRFESRQDDANWAKLSRPWIGTLTSADISPAR